MCHATENKNEGRKYDCNDNKVEKPKAFAQWMQDGIRTLIQFLPSFWLKGKMNARCWAFMCTWNEFDESEWGTEQCGNRGLSGWCREESAEERKASSFKCQLMRFIETLFSRSRLRFSIFGLLDVRGPTTCVRWIACEALNRIKEAFLRKWFECDLHWLPNVSTCSHN